MGYTVILFDSTRTKFGIFTVVSVKGTLVEDKMRRFKGECAHFSFKKCPVYTHGASSIFSTNETLFLVQVCSGESGGGWDGLPGGEGLGPPGSGSQVNRSIPPVPQPPAVTPSRGVTPPAQRQYIQMAGKAACLASWRKMTQPGEFCW